MIYLILRVDPYFVSGWLPVRVARIQERDGQETFVVVNSDAMAITRAEIVKHIGMRLPLDLQDFLFGQYSKEVRRDRNMSFNHKLTEFRLLAPIVKTFKVICLAFNYSDQASWVRFGKDPPKDPVIYMKPRTSLAGPFDDILCPKFVRQLDYEGELALVIGRKCKKIDGDEALNSVGGYFILNDVSARDIQFIDKQYARAKGFDTFGPCGPWVTTPDEIPDPCNLHITTRVNGETRQDSSTKNLVLKVGKIISRLSNVMTLEPGDVISTGTPSGTALSLSSHTKYLQHDDVVEVEIERLGKIKNKVRFVD